MRFTFASSTEQADFAVIEVEDHGIGMDWDEQQRAFQPFGQAKPATTRNYGGTGFGLPITKGLVEAHGGALTILSRPAKVRRSSWFCRCTRQYPSLRVDSVMRSNAAPVE